MQRVPFFGSIPVFGALFRHNGEKDEKHELLVFITPKIIKSHFPLSYDDTKNANTLPPSKGEDA